MTPEGHSSLAGWPQTGIFMIIDDLYGAIRKVQSKISGKCKIRCEIKCFLDCSGNMTLQVIAAEAEGDSLGSIKLNEESLRQENNNDCAVDMLCAVIGRYCKPVDK